MNRLEIIDALCGIVERLVALVRQLLCQAITPASAEAELQELLDSYEANTGDIL